MASDQRSEAFPLACAPAPISVPNPITPAALRNLRRRHVTVKPGTVVRCNKIHAAIRKEYGSTQLKPVMIGNKHLFFFQKEDELYVNTGRSSFC